MADEDWKKRVGVNINYNSDSEGDANGIHEGKEEEQFHGDTSPECDANMSQFHNNSTESSLDALLHKYEQYGSTPPRTRLSRHIRDWKRREKDTDRKETSQSKIARRNTFDAMYIDNSDIAESDSEQPAQERICKRNMKLLRGSERDLKLDLSHASEIHSFSVDSGVDRAESVPLGSQPAIKVESSNRFMSLTSKLVACQHVKKFKCGLINSMNSRQELYNSLVPLSGPEKLPDKITTRQLSNEEYRWQNDMKDLIWLELQAWHASRSLPDQDDYLCKAREEVDILLHDIMEYQFKFDTMTHPHESPQCRAGLCLSMYCAFCIDRQNTAIRDIEKLSNRLEHAESLFPSSKAFAASYPLYKDEKFIARVKSLCLWLNMTKQHRLKMLILGKLFICRSQAPWSLPWEPDSGRGSNGAEDSGRGSTGTNTETEQDSPPVEDNPRKKLEWKPSVRFDTEYTGSSPSDSAGSNSSTSIYEMPDVVDYSSCLAAISQQICPHKKDKSSPYRLFIEEVLKTKGLRKSVRFLERLHRYTLVRSCITLEKPSEIPVTDDKRLECAHEEELRRHGFWSQELQEIGLPSYHSSFLFLARIPLRLINEYLDMRLEQQPEKPSDLCLRQLMRELKEGLRLAVMFRERFESLIVHAFSGVRLEQDLYEDVHDLDKSSQRVFQMYLDYLQRWCHLVEQESYQKSLLDEEWVFAKQVAIQIPTGVNMISGRFCCISKAMLGNLGNSLTSQVEDLTSLVCDSKDEFKEQVTKQSILTMCRELQCVFNDMRERFLKAFTFAKTLKKDVEAMGSQQHLCLDGLKNEALKLCKTIKMAMECVETTFSVTDGLDIDALENEAVQASIRETLHQGYKFGFEYHKEVCKNVTGDIKPVVSRVLNEFATMWMNFVKQRCERGRGIRPKWANQGLDYLLAVCDTANTQYLTEEEFKELKTRVQDCTQYIIGKNDPARDMRLTDSPTRANSPTPRPRFRLPRSPHDTNGRLQTPTRKSSINTPSDGSVDSPSPQERKNVMLYVCPRSRMERVRSAVDNLERNVDHKLRAQNLIGYVTAVHKEDRVHIRLRQVNFSWQRGIKIGQGSFGKVYTAVNNQTGELMAMKEVQLQPNDHRTIKKIAQELAIFEGIQHKHLVRYYGVEIHRDEMLIFMEFCEEGTLETLVAATSYGLPEPLVRRFTLQLMQAVHTLHSHGIVHRDIKSANIFLTDEGNCLKLGDFGSAVKIKAHTTMPGELQGFVGTQAYMAPEVFTKMHTEGHGRAVDIWSVGCVVVEMASGKRPWAELDSNYQVMFKVGMGETPAIPPSISEEGYDFVDHCLQHDPQQRATAADLLQHTFLKVDGEEPLLSLLPSIIDDYGHFGNTR